MASFILFSPHELWPSDPELFFQNDDCYSTMLSLSYIGGLKLLLNVINLMVVNPQDKVFRSHFNNTTGHEQILIQRARPYRLEEICPNLRISRHILNLRRTAHN